MKQLAPYRLLKSTKPVWLCLFLLGCASSSFFISYPQQLVPVKNQVAQGQAMTAAEKLGNKGTGPNSLLDSLESARLMAMAGEFKQSQKQFEKVFGFFNKTDNQAKLSLSEGGSLLGSVAVNDNAFPYKAEAFERIFAYHYQSLNFLGQGDLEAAMVEIRRANEEQVFALEQHHKELAKAEEEAKEKDISAEPEQFKEKLKANFEAASKVKNSFQNAYTFYYSGIIREANGDTNGAYIDYKKALEIYPTNSYLQKDVWRLATGLQMKDDIAHFEKVFSAENKIKQTEKINFYIFYEESLVPAKAEIFLPFNTFDRIHSFAFPTYLAQWQASSSVRVSSGNNVLGSTEEIVNTHALAAKALQEGSFSRILRQMLRVNTKARLQREASKESDNGLGLFFASAYSMISERADLRSWLSLPNGVQVARFSLSPGSHQIQINKATFRHEINVNIDENEKVLVLITNPAEQHIYSEVFSF